MAINPTVKVVTTETRFLPVVGAISKWSQVGDDDYLRKVDNWLITNPDTQIVEASRQIFSRGGRPAQWLSLRMRYSSGFTITRSPLVRLFGRVDAGNEWQCLVNGEGGVSIEIAVAATDIESGGPN